MRAFLLGGSSVKINAFLKYSIQNAQKRLKSWFEQTKIV